MPDGGAVDEDVVGGLEVEGFLDFGVGCYEKMEEGDEEEEGVEEGICDVRWVVWCGGIWGETYR